MQRIVEVNFWQVSDSGEQLLAGPGQPSAGLRTSAFLWRYGMVGGSTNGRCTDTGTFSVFKYSVMAVCTISLNHVFENVLRMFHSKVVSQVWACLHSHCWGHIQKGFSSHGRQGLRFHRSSKSEPLPANIPHSLFAFFLDAIESPSTYPCQSVTVSESVDHW